MESEALLLRKALAFEIQRKLMKKLKMNNQEAQGG